MIWKKHDQNKFLKKLSSKPKTSQFTIDFNALVVILRLNPSSLTYEMILFLGHTHSKNLSYFKLGLAL
jgi:hypothetical protein